MKLLDLLLKYLPDSGGWPKFAVAAFNLGADGSVRFRTQMGFMDVVFDESCSEVGTVTREEYEREKFNYESRLSFESSAKALMKWINDNGQPHQTIIIDATSAVLYSGEKSITTEEFIKD